MVLALRMRCASSAFLIRQSCLYLHVSVSIGISNICKTERLLLIKCSEIAVWM